MAKRGARTVMIIRHAEKPDGRARGVKTDGRKRASSLTVRGWQRAGALVQLFRGTSRSRSADRLPAPASIFASCVEAGEKSRRPRQTVRPLADRLGLKVDHRYGLDAEVELANVVRDATNPVLICWHHEAIPKLASLIAPDVVVPPEWPADRFDIVWLLDQRAPGKPWTLDQFAQMLLAGDLDATISPG